SCRAAARREIQQPDRARDPPLPRRRVHRWASFRACKPSVPGGEIGRARGGLMKDRPRTLDVNVDMGEGFGRWQLGDDAGIMPFITSASIACGFHAGDPGTMRRTVRAAIEQGVEIGAHVALPDLL